MTCVHALSKFYTLPRKWESLGICLPRNCLNWAEIHGNPGETSSAQVQAALAFWRSLRIALVKQTAYQGLYPESATGAWIPTVLRSGCHLGPFSFLADLGADYWVVRQADEPETFLWREKYSGATDSEALFEARMEDVRRIEEDPGLKTFRVQDVKWDQYDLVIGIDVPVPEKIVRSHPKTLWAYISAEAGGPLQKNSLRYPLAGYQLFLNHGFRRYRSRPNNRSHVLEFPLQFQSSNAWSSLRQAIPPQPARETILVGAGSWEDSPPASPLPWDHLSGSLTPAYLAQMFSARFTVHTTSRPRWGNWAIEATQAGSLFLGNAASLAHLSLLLPGLDCRSLSDASEKISSLLKNPEHLQALQSRQADLAEELAFRRPLLDLTAKAREFFQS
jgi:hypothetical protein